MVLWPVKCSLFIRAIKVVKSTGTGKAAIYSLGEGAGPDVCSGRTGLTIKGFCCCCFFSFSFKYLYGVLRPLFLMMKSPTVFFKLSRSSLSKRSSRKQSTTKYKTRFYHSVTIWTNFNQWGPNRINKGQLGQIWTQLDQPRHLYTN